MLPSLIPGKIAVFDKTQFAMIAFIITFGEIMQKLRLELSGLFLPSFT